jgi:peptidoglycan/xylan/chitin deacetylase (PgdA/CDA1 family)
VTRALKLSVYQICKWVGLFHVARFVTRRGLRILCYHGFSLQDEHQFRPKLFIRPHTFVQRMRYLRENEIPVLPLTQAIEALTNGTLPDGATVITVDDGFHSVFQKALPVLQENRLPSTVYVTTYYVERQNPIFRLAVQYMFWKTRQLKLQTAGLISGTAEQLDLRNAHARDAWMWDLIRFGETQCREEERCALAEELGKRLDIDYGEVVRNRALSLMTPEEICTLLASQVDVQLHTHRHRFPAERDAAMRELRDNEKALEHITGRRCTHFCYPSGLWSENHWPWLQQSGVQTAVTCEPGLNNFATPRYALRRFLDGEDISQIEFEAEIFGFAEVLRNVRASFRNRESRNAPD